MLKYLPRTSTTLWPLKFGSVLIRSSNCSKGTRWISGTGWLRKLCWNRCLVNKCMHTPGITRPARPFRCIALARDTHTSSSDSIFRLESKRFSFINPQSITKTQSSIVTEVSAMLVVRTIFRLPGGAGRNTAVCSSLESDEWSGTSTNLLDLFKT